MGRRLTVRSAHPKLSGQYLESGSCEGRPAYVKNCDEVWLVFSERFGAGPGWYFASSFPQAGELRSFCRSDLSDAAAPELATWPQELRLELRQDEEIEVPFGSPTCSACKEVQELFPGLRCEVCAPEDAVALKGLRLLQEKTSSMLCQKTATAFAEGDADARRLLESIHHAHATGSTELILVRQPPPCVEIGTGTMSLLCDVISFSEPSSARRVQYSWHKDGQPLPRAGLPRLVLSGACDAEGSYTCVVTAGEDSITTRSCEVRLSAEAKERLSQKAQQRQRFESPLRRAAGAVQMGDLARAIQLLTEAIQAATDDEAVRAEALCQRAELRVRRGQWQEAFQDAVDALKLQPSLARAHAARGAAAEELGFLAEAASSWEAAELLGGVPSAAQRAEACRQKLQQFFMEQQAKRGTKPGGAGDDPEDRWRRNGWEGRYVGGSAGSYFGGGQASGSSGTSSELSKALQQNLQVLGFQSSELPSAETLRSAYRKLALAMHPDKPGGSKTAFQELQNAYEAVLKVVSG